MLPYCGGKLERPPSIIGSVAISITITMNAIKIPKIISLAFVILSPHHYVFLMWINARI